MNSSVESPARKVAKRVTQPVRAEAEPFETEPKTLIETAYRKLRQDIVEGSYPPGTKLRVEHLKPLYKVSAGTLREALGLLVSDSLVVAQGQRGFRVAPMSLADIEDLTRMRIILECEALRESIHSGGDDWEARVVGAFHKLTLAEERSRSDPGGAFNEWEIRNREFHDALVSACSSPWIHRLRTLLYRQAERYRRLTVGREKSLVSVQHQHREIFDAVISRDASRAHVALASHIQHSLTVIRDGKLLG
jgi:DNA-binding GntR family transcriptional regulator